MELMPHQLRELWRRIAKKASPPSPDATPPPETAPPSISPDAVPPPPDTAPPVTYEPLIQSVIDEQNRILLDHPAFQIFGANRFSEKAIAESPEIRHFILNITRMQNLNNLKRKDWLQKKIGEVDALMTVSPLTSEDISVCNGIKDNLKRIEQAYQSQDDRVHRERESVQDRKEGKIDSSKSEGAMMEAIRLTGDTSLEAVAKNLNVYDVTDPDRRKHTGTPGHYDLVATHIRQRINDILSSIDQTSTNPAVISENQAKRTAIEKLEKASDAVALAYVEKHHHGKGSFTDEIEDRYGGSYENMRKALENDPRLRDYWFYKILQPILYNARREDHRSLYNLQEQGNMTAFMNVIRAIPEKGEKLVGHYTMLRNLIFQSHDMDYNCAHPSLDFRGWSESVSAYTTTYMDFGIQNPMVAMAKRFYLTALMQMREDHGGFVPHEYLEWKPGDSEIEIDRRVKEMLKMAIQSGQLRDVKRDPLTNDYITDEHNRIVTDPSNTVSWDDLYGGQLPGTGYRYEYGDLSIAAALKVAKALNLVDTEFLTVLARSVAGGSDVAAKKIDNYSFVKSGLSEPPYGKLLGYFEPIIHNFARYKVGGRKFYPFFSMMITDNPNFNHEQIKDIMDLHIHGRYKELREKYGEDVETRLNAADNPFSFSGMHGNFTKWRAFESTAAMDDWEKERTFSTAQKIGFVGDSYIRAPDGNTKGKNKQNMQGIASRKVDEYFLRHDTVHKAKTGDNIGKTAHEYYQILRKDYHDRLMKSEDASIIHDASDPVLFEKKWRRIGMMQVADDKGNTYEDLLKNHAKGIRSDYGEEKWDAKKLQMQHQLERAYKAKIWVQATMRNPLTVAREWRVKYDVNGFQREGPLRKKIIKNLLGIDIDEFGKNRAPTKYEQTTLNRITQIEGAIATVREIAIRENRDLRDEDFEGIYRGSKDADKKAIREMAKSYWYQVQDAMLGDKTSQEWYEKLGITESQVEEKEVRDHINRISGENTQLKQELSQSLRYDVINWDRIQDIRLDNFRSEKKGDDSIFNKPQGFTSDLMTATTVDRDWKYLFTAEDMGMEYQNLRAQGERSAARRIGDLGSHQGFLQGLDKLLNNVIQPKLDKEKFYETLGEMKASMQGDDLDVAYDSVSRIAYTTLQMYRKSDWVWKVPIFGPAIGLLKDTSIAETLWTNRRAQSMGPNDLLKCVHELVEHDLILPTEVNPLTGEPDFSTEWSAETMLSRLGANGGRVSYEAITKILPIIFVILAWKALTSTPEDEDR